MVVGSRHNARVRQVRRLRSRKHRERTGLFYIEGIRQVAEAVQMRAPLETIVVARELLASPFARALLEAPERAGVSRLSGLRVAPP